MHAGTMSGATEHEAAPMSSSAGRHPMQRTALQPPHTDRVSAESTGTATPSCATEVCGGDAGSAGDAGWAAAAAGGAVGGGSRSHGRLRPGGPHAPTRVPVAGRGQVCSMHPASGLLRPA